LGGKENDSIRYDNGMVANRTDYTTDLTDIREVAQKYGHTEDTMELYDDDGQLVAVATWPQGSKVYKYCTGKNLDPNPAWRVFVC
jgi:hypothetical protein